MHKPESRVSLVAAIIAGAATLLSGCMLGPNYARPETETPAAYKEAQGWKTALAVAWSGPMTALPLMWFAIAARRMPYTLVGFLQFLSPTVVFIMGLTVFGEPLKPAQLACYVAIWAAAALFSWELLRGHRQANA